MKLFAIFFITLLTVSIVSGSCTLSKAGRCAQDFGRNSHRAMGNKKLVCHVANDKTEPASCTSYHINPKFCLEMVVQRTLSNDLVIKWWFHKRSTSWTMPTDLNPGWRPYGIFHGVIKDRKVSIKEKKIGKYTVTVDVYIGDSIGCGQVSAVAEKADFYEHSLAQQLRMNADVCSRVFAILLAVRAAREFQACIYELGECRGMSKNVVDRTIKKIIDSGCKLHSGTTIQKAQTISVILPVLLLGHCLQLRI